MRLIIFSVIALFGYSAGYAQGCCSGGGGSSIVGGAASGVLLKNQMEISLNYQYLQSNKFYTEDHESDPLYDNFYSNYLFFRTDYGITNNLTMSVATGYYLSRYLVELDGESIFESSGMGDLILFPRYNIYAKEDDNKRTDIALGVGMKIPLGSHDDSSLIFSHPVAGDFYAYSPPAVQTTTGSQDFLFNLYVYRGYPKRNIRFFANSLFIRKGFNSLGMKFGDYASLGLFVGKTYFNKLGLTLQIKGEWNSKMEAADGVDLIANNNVYLSSTGSKKVFFVPQISYTFNSLTVYATSDIPMYQYLEGTQVGSQYQLTAGLVFRFYVKQPEIEPVKIYLNPE